MDAYRLSGDEDFFETGGRDMLGDPKSLCLVEWSERLPETFGPESERIDIEVLEDGTRKMTLTGPWLEGIFA
jgi:tRNA A37 threonylcarbamoyladenosine biosynthesis protein TsaE